MRFIALFLLLGLPCDLLAASSNSGLPIPRFVSLKNAETNVRTGPGTRYPIHWVYRREGMPVEVIEEYDLWRKIRDAEGTAGWVHKAMLEGKRNAMIIGKEPQMVRIDSNSKSKAILKAEPNVIVQMLECEPEWCRMQISGRKGWIEKKNLWGVYKKEIFD